ncbi:hypothetical protein FORC066_0692 [Yersinia enterocolitica]|nr:hypothetical protein FORC066_0692 [Yersinia enterocolitica]
MHSFAALLQHQLLWVTSFLIRAAAVLAALIHPNHLPL